MPVLLKEKPFFFWRFMGNYEKSCMDVGFGDLRAYD